MVHPFAARSAALPSTGHQTTNNNHRKQHLCHQARQPNKNASAASPTGGAILAWLPPQFAASALCSYFFPLYCNAPSDRVYKPSPRLCHCSPCHAMHLRRRARRALPMHTTLHHASLSPSLDDASPLHLHADIFLLPHAPDCLFPCSRMPPHQNDQQQQHQSPQHRAYGRRCSTPSPWHAECRQPTNAPPWQRHLSAHEGARGGLYGRVQQLGQGRQLVLAVASANGLRLLAVAAAAR